MIRVRCKPDSGDFSLEIKGHGDKLVCAAASGMAQAAALGLKALAQAHPNDIAFEEVGPRPEPKTPR